MPERVKCINPVGIGHSVNTYGLAPRLKTLDGKNVCLSICGEPDITIPLERRLKTDYPQVNWTLKKTYGISPMKRRSRPAATLRVYHPLRKAR